MHSMLKLKSYQSRKHARNQSYRGVRVWLVRVDVVSSLREAPCTKVMRAADRRPRRPSEKRF